MGYLDQPLTNNPGQIVSCDDLYPLWLKVKHATGIDQITRAETDLTVSMIVKQMVPDVENWQYGGDINGFYIFKFQNAAHRAQAQARLVYEGYTTELRDFIK